MKQCGIWIGVLVGAAFIAWLIHCFVFSSYLVLSSDMEDTLYPGERIIVNKWSYGLRLPYTSWWRYYRCHKNPVCKGDVVVFNNPADCSEKVIDRRTVFISRCIAIPGDTLSIDSCRFVVPRQGSSILINKVNCRLFCNIIQTEGKLTFVRNDTLYVNGHSVRKYVFLKNYYLMASDKGIGINNTRFFGFVPMDHIIGKALFVWFSKNNEKKLFEGYRWNRLFCAIN